MGVRLDGRTGALGSGSQVCLGQRRGTPTGWRFSLDRLSTHGVRDVDKSSSQLKGCLSLCSGVKVDCWQILSVKGSKCGMSVGGRRWGKQFRKKNFPAWVRVRGFTFFTNASLLVEIVCPCSDVVAGISAR